ncbi:MAG: M16 family metallopeptidase, partial [Candidatus Izemoplasmataceae bacterium]
MKLTTIKENNVTYHYIKTNQFKSNVISIRFFEPYEEKSALTRYLMFQMLKAKTKKYPSRKKMSEAIDALYDGLLSVQSTKFGTYHVNTVNLMVIHDRYTLGDELFKEALNFLNALIHEPLFDEASLEEEKAFLSDMIKAEYANKTRFASKEYSSYLMQDHPYKGFHYGDLANLKAVNIPMIHEAFLTMMQKNSIVLSVTGDLESESAHQAVKNALTLKGYPINNAIIYRHDFHPKEDYFYEAIASQNRLFVGLKTPIFYKDDDYLSMVVLVSLLGEGSDSLLFKTIREQNSLAYYVYASYSPFTGIITLSSGLDTVNVPKAYEMMIDILDSLKQGLFSDEDFNLAKTSLISSYKQSFDHITALSMKALRHML